MTTEIVQYKCPSCGHLLGEEEFKHACEKSHRQVFEKVQQGLQTAEQQIKQLKNEHAKELERKDEKNKMEREKEISTRVANIVNEQMAWTELKHKEELETKNREIEAAKLQNATLIEEKVRQAIIPVVAQYRQAEEEYKSQIRRIEAHNRELKDTVEDQKRTIDSIPPERKGTSSEFVLIDELKEEFKTDDITGKKVGVAMADVVQYVVTEIGERIPIPIVYDKKMGKLVTASDIMKAKNYKTVHNTNYCLIVTEDIRRDNVKHIRSKFTEERNGVLLVHPDAVVDIARRIRSFLIENSKQTKNNNGRDSKQSKLYDYLTSPEYSRDMQVRMEAKLKLDELQRKEEDYHRTTWSRRKEFIEKWFNVDHKHERIIDDITQEDQSSDEDEVSKEEDG